MEGKTAAEVAEGLVHGNKVWVLLLMMARSHRSTLY